MIIDEYCIFGESNKNKRRELNKKGYISSVELSKYNNEFGIQKPAKNNLKHMREFCKTSEIYDCIRFNVSGTIKYWFKLNQIKKSA